VQLCTDASRAFLVGYRPGKVAPELRLMPNDALSAILETAQSSELGKTFYTIGPSVLAQHIDTAAPGSLNLRRRYQNPSGVYALKHTHIATPVVITSLDGVVRACSNHPASSLIQRDLTVVSNPYAGLHQQDARDLENLVGTLVDSAAVMWLGSSHAVQMLAPDAALDSLRARLSLHLASIEPTKPLSPGAYQHV
jgi:hypothetical protein